MEWKALRKGGWFLGLVLLLLTACTHGGSRLAVPGKEASQGLQTAIRLNLEKAGIAPRTLVVGFAVAPPFVYHASENSELQGLEVDLLKMLAEAQNYRLEWVEMPFAALIPAVENGKIDLAVGGLYITPERLAVVNFTEPYLESGLVIVVRHGLEAQVQTPEDLAWLRLGVKFGATGAAMAQKLQQQGIIMDVHEYKDTLDSLLDLEVDRVDAVLNDYLNTMNYLNTTASSLQMVMDETGQPLFLSHSELGIAVSPHSDGLVSALNQTLQSLRGQGTLDNLKQRWITPPAP